MSTEDSPAQLREQIAAALFPPVRKGQEAWEAVADAVMLVVLAQVETAKATARRDALLECADDYGTPGMSATTGYVKDWLRTRASAQGAAAPAELTCRCGRIARNTDVCVDCGSERAVQHEHWPGRICSTCLHVRVDSDPDLTAATAEVAHQLLDAQHPSGQSAQSSGHEHFGSGGSQWCDRCGEAPDDPIHQRVPGQPGEQDTAEEPALTQQEQDGLDYP